MSATTAVAGLSGTLARGVLALPEPVQRVLGGPPPAGAPDLAPEARLLARLAARLDRFDREDRGGEVPARARAAFVAQAAGIGGRPRFEGRTEERTVPGAAGPLRARLYVPHAAPAPAPLLVFLHGGGWTRGSVDSHDAPCRALAQQAGIRVLSAEYRLAPEHPFPAAADDALAVWRHVAAEPEAYGGEPGRLAIGGDSAGGNLAAVTAIGARDAGLPAPALQLLIYPATDLSRKHPSIRTFSTGYLLSEADTDRYKRLYVPDPARWSDPRASPFLAPDLAGLAPAAVLTAAADPLRDEGEAYAARLREAGVQVHDRRHPHLHGFLNMPTARGAGAGVAWAAGALRDALHATG